MVAISKYQGLVVTIGCCCVWMLPVGFYNHGALHSTSCQVMYVLPCLCAFGSCTRRICSLCVEPGFRAATLCLRLLTILISDLM